MRSEFPYQIVTFLDRQPEQGEPVYGGERGWLPQVALKRRFTLRDTTEQEFIDNLRKFFGSIEKLAISTGELVKPDRMPVRVVHITSQDVLRNLHNKILEQFSGKMISKFPDREGDNYYPHITAEYDGRFVIPYDRYVDRKFKIDNVWLLKDIDSEDSVAYKKIAAP